MRFIVLTLLFSFAAMASSVNMPLDFNVTAGSKFQNAIQTQKYPLELFKDINKTGKSSCLDVYESNITLKRVCLDDVAFLKLFIPTENTERIKNDKNIIRAYFDKDCGTQCFDWIDTGELTGTLECNSSAKINAFGLYIAKQTEEKTRKDLAVDNRQHDDSHHFCDINASLKVVNRLRLKQYEYVLNRNLSDNEEWQLYKNEHCLRLIATETFSKYSERKKNLEKNIFTMDKTAQEKELEEEAKLLRKLSDANISIRLPKDERFFQDIYDYNSWFVKMYAGYEFIGVDNVFKDGTGRFGLSVYRQMELDPSETRNGFWEGFSLTRLHLLFDLAISGLVVKQPQEDANSDLNITEVAKTGISRLGAYWPFFRSDAGVDGARYFVDFGIVGTFGLMSVENDGNVFFENNTTGNRLTDMWSWGFRISSSPEMYAEYKWGQIGDYKADVLRGQFPAYTFTKNSSMILGAELFDFKDDANERGIDDQVKFYILWRYDLSWADEQLQ